MSTSASDYDFLKAPAPILGEDLTATGLVDVRSKLLVKICCRNTRPELDAIGL